jgi:hypothetical protein
VKIEEPEPFNVRAVKEELTRAIKIKQETLTHCATQTIAGVKSLPELSKVFILPYDELLSFSLNSIRFGTSDWVSCFGMTFTDGVTLGCGLD